MRKITFNAALLTTVAVSQASGQVVNGQITGLWGGFTLGAEYRDDSGTAIADTSNLLFQLGVFNGITPTPDNADQWRANWTPIYESGLDAFSTFGGNVDFGPTAPSTAVGPGSDPALVAGQQLYIWGFDSTQPSYDPTSGVVPEWLLFTGPANPENPALSTSNWVTPDYLSNPGLLTNHQPSTVNLTAANSPTIIVGNFDIQGQASDFFQFQAVPEPSSSILIGLAALGLLRRRQR